MQLVSAWIAVRRGPQALFLELLHLVDEALAFFADAIALRHAHLVEVDQAGVATTSCRSCVIFCATLDARASFIGTARSGDLFLCAGAFAGVDQHAHPVGLQAVGDPHLVRR